MNKPIIYSAALLISMLSAGAAQAADAVATVNGKPISQQSYEDYLKQRMAQNPNAQLQNNRTAVINELVNRELLYQEAQKMGLHKDKQILEQIEQQRINLLIQAALSRSPVAKPITEEDLKKEYDSKIANANVQEYKARHILVKEEAKAKELIKQLQGGADFAELAKKESIGPSAKSGGDLGWFNPGQMVPPFSQAVQAMKKGSFSDKPVQTQFGWHVIKLEDSRKLEAPSFDSVKNQIGSFIQNQRLQEYISTLRDKAKIEIK